jgi:hypothetical protein
MCKLLYIIIGAILIGCGQSKINNEESPSQIYGEWILVNVSGGITGDIRDIDTETDKHILIITKDSTISYSHNNSLVSSSKFRIEKRKSIYSPDEMDFIVYGNKKPPEVISKFSGDTLGIADNHYDGFTNIYIRKK